jgi:hypothetical protein
VRVFGCPSYVLDPRLQDGFKIPKWEPRARLGQFLGFSSSRSTTIGTIRNLCTGYVSPQYHVVYDKTFTTVTSSQSLDCEEYWNDLYLHHRDHYVENFYNMQDIPPLHESWLTPEETIQRRLIPTTTTILDNNPSNNTTPTDITSTKDEVFHDALETIQPRNLLEDLDTSTTSTPNTGNQASEEELMILPEDTIVDEPPPHKHDENGKETINILGINVSMLEYAVNQRPE